MLDLCLLRCAIVVGDVDCDLVADALMALWASLCRQSVHVGASLVKAPT